MVRRQGRMLAFLALAFVSCKEKTGEAPDAGAAPSASSNASAAPPPPPSASATTPPILTTLVGFEGGIRLVAQSGDPGVPSQNVTLFVRGDRIRLDSIPGTDAARALGGKAHMLLRVPEKKLDILVEAKKQVVELDLNNPDNLKALSQASSHKANPAEPAPTMTKTGRKATVAGYTCEEWEIRSSKDQKKTQNVCVADLDSTFFHLSIPGLPEELGFVKEVIDGKHFPLRIISYGERTGAESGRLEVVRIEPHVMDAAKFEVPPDYTVLDMMQLMASMSGGPGGPGRPPMPNIPGLPSNVPADGPARPHAPR